MDEKDKQAEPVAWESALEFAAQTIELYDDATMKNDYMLDASECAAIIRALKPMHPAQPVAADVGNLEYMGNSVSFIYQKMRAYKDGIGKVWQALRDNGIHPDGQTHAADAIRKALAQPVQPAGAVNQQELCPSCRNADIYACTCPFKTARNSQPECFEPAPAVAVNDQLLAALKKAEAALSDIGDAEREEFDDLAWCEGRAWQELSIVRKAIAAAEAEKAKGGV